MVHFFPFFEKKSVEFLTKKETEKRNVWWNSKPKKHKKTKKKKNKKSDRNQCKKIIIKWYKVKFWAEKIKNLLFL